MAIGDLDHDQRHCRPQGATDTEVEAAGKVSEALEWVERARGHLYTFHQLMGRADFLLGDAVDLLDEAGATELADHVAAEAVGRNVLDGRWTFQIVEEFDDLYYEAIRAVERRVRDQLTAGRRHVFEAELKERRRSRGRAGHEFRPAAVHGQG